MVILPGIAPPPEQSLKPTSLKKRVGGRHLRTHKTVVVNNNVVVVVMTVLCAVHWVVEVIVVVVVVV